MLIEAENKPSSREEPPYADHKNAGFEILSTRENLVIAELVKLA